MKSILLILITTIPFIGVSQKLSCEEAAELYSLAVQNFHSSPLLIHKKDKKILVTKPGKCQVSLPKKVGKSKIDRFYFDDDLTANLKGDITKHNGRSVILISHKQRSTDSVSVRVDQWTVSNLEIREILSPINQDIYPEYKNKNHDYLFVRVDSSWRLTDESNNANPTTTEKREVEKIFQKANSLHNQGKYSEALKLVNRSLAMDSSLYQRYMFRARIKVKLEMFESAISDITKCIERCDCSTRKAHVPSYYLKRAEIHNLNKDYNAALNDINKSISLNTEDWRALTSRAALFIRFKDFENALIDLNNSIALKPNQPVTYYYRGLVNLNLGFKKAACSDFKAAIKAGHEESKQWFTENCK